MGILAIIGSILFVSFCFQFLMASSIDKKLMTLMSQNTGLFHTKSLDCVMRAAMLSYAQHVFPGGSCFNRSCLENNYPAFPTFLVCYTIVILSLTVAPFVNAFHCFMPPTNFITRQYALGGQGMGDVSQRGWPLFRFYLKHPFAIWGEGFGNGAGLACYSGLATAVYPYARMDHFRKIFHDKLYQEGLFLRHNAPQAKIFGVFQHGKIEKRDNFADASALPLMWKPIFATMGLGIFPCKTPTETPPSKAPYMLTEKIIPAHFPRAEWFRVATIWPYGTDKPKFSYCWRTINEEGDDRIQTEIIGGDMCFIPGAGPNFVGRRKDYGLAEDAHGFWNYRNGKMTKADQYYPALLAAVEQAIEMHMDVGPELFSVGWDVMVDTTGHKFLEFNINNGFLMADHGVKQCERLCHYFEGQADMHLMDRF